MCVGVLGLGGVESMPCRCPHLPGINAAPGFVPQDRVCLRRYPEAGFIPLRMSCATSILRDETIAGYVIITVRDLEK
jgi:hypothetical protein